MAARIKKAPSRKSKGGDITERIPLEENISPELRMQAAVMGSKNSLYKIMKAESSTSIEDEDPFIMGDFAEKIIPPPLDIRKLADLPDQSSVLPQCIQSMATNIDGFGFELDYIGPPAETEEDGEIKPKTGPDSPEAIKEKTNITSFFETINPWESWESIRKKMRCDRETTGNGYLEIIRSRTKDISYVSHVPSKNVRLLKLDPEATSVDVKLIRNGKSVNVTTEKRFRRFIQMIHTKKVFFKEYGDPRVINKTTGSVATATLPTKSQANEIIWLKNYHPGTPYGMPRYIGTLISIYGARKAEELNYSYFINSTIPPAIVMISGGILTNSAFEQLRSYWSEETRGVDKMHKVLLIEAVPTSGSVSGKENVPRIDIKPLNDQRLQDALFQQYDEKHRDKVRSTFRIPPLFLGESSDYTKACYSEDTETLTENGWKHHYEITDEDKIAAYSPTTKTMEFAKPSKKYIYDVSEELIHFKSKTVDCLMTEDHTVLISPYDSNVWGVEKAGSIPYQQFKVLTAPENYNGTEKTNFSSSELRFTDGNITRELYTGRVYCYSVPDYGFFVTRRNGKVTIQGNTAQAARGVTEEQVFVPERHDFDFVVNRTIMQELGAKFYRFRSKAPEIGDNDVMVRAVDAFSRAGALTGNMARTLMKETIGFDAPEIMGAWGDIPFQLVIELAKQQNLKGTEQLMLQSPQDKEKEKQKFLTAQRKLTDGAAKPDGTIKPDAPVVAAEDAPKKITPPVSGVATDVQKFIHELIKMRKSLNSKIKEEEEEGGENDDDGNADPS